MAIRNYWLRKISSFSGACLLSDYCCWGERLSGGRVSNRLSVFTRQCCLHWQIIARRGKYPDAKQTEGHYLATVMTSASPKALTCHGQRPRNVVFSDHSRVWYTLIISRFFYVHVQTKSRALFSDERHIYWQAKGNHRKAFSESQDFMEYLRL